MSLQTMSPQERRQLLDGYYQRLKNLTYPHNQAFTIAQRQAMARERDALVQEYGERLPFVPLSRCPFCGSVLEYPLDAEGLDGPWWYKGDLTEFPSPHGCKHFRVLLGAINFNSMSPAEAKVNGEVLAGPGAPFVVPRMLAEVPNVKAVISSFQMPPGYTCYPAAYFSENPLHGALLHQPWGRQAYQVRNAEGVYEGWTSANDQWDFDLQPWINKGLLLWINPGDQAHTLQNQPPCPYVNLPGIRAPQKIVQGNLEICPLPTGEKLEPFE